MEEEQHTDPPSPEGKENDKMKKIIMAILLLLLLIFGVALFLMSDGSEDTSEQSQSTENSDTQSTEDSLPAEAGDDFDRIVYAHTDTDGNPKSIFSRPASGGDRVDLPGQLPSSVFSVSRSGEAFAYYDQSTNQVWYGQGEQTPKMIYTVSSDVDITSINLNDDAGQIAISTVEKLDGTAPFERSIFSIDTQGMNVSPLVTENSEDFGALFIVDWNPSNGHVLFRSSCWQCDGFNQDVYLWNGSETKLILDLGGYSGTVAGYSVKSDFSEMIYITGTAYSDIEIQDYNIQIGLGSFGGPPFTLSSINLETEEIITLATFGEIADITGEFSVLTTLGWTSTSGNEVPYYSYKSKLFAQNGTGGFDNLFETGQGDIQSTYAVTDDEVLVGSSMDDGLSEVISYFNIETTTAETVMETTYNTRILSITRK